MNSLQSHMNQRCSTSTLGVIGESWIFKKRSSTVRISVLNSAVNMLKHWSTWFPEKKEQYLFTWEWNIFNYLPVWPTSRKSNVTSSKILRSTKACRNPRTYLFLFSLNLIIFKTAWSLQTNLQQLSKFRWSTRGKTLLSLMKSLSRRNRTETTLKKLVV